MWRELPNETTVDTLFSGALSIEQPRRGYRFNVDAILLASFAATKTARCCVDLGAGVGTVALALRHLGGAKRVELVEVESVFAGLARRNLERAGAEGGVHESDLLRGLPRALERTADLVTCNPPFFEPGEAQAPRDARTERSRLGKVGPFLKAAARAFRTNRARAAFVYPARSLEPFLATAKDCGLVPKRVRFVHPSSDAPARLVLVELLRAKPGGLVIEPPLVEWAAPGVRSPAVIAILEANAHKGDRK
jgi:tRNA1Val (adenine37-N6)-methyltransferase